MEERSVFQQETEKMRQREYQSREARKAAGMGFGRLLWLIVLGLLLADAIRAVLGVIGGFLLKSIQ